MNNTAIPVKKEFITSNFYKFPKSGEEKQEYIRRFVVKDTRVRQELPDVNARIKAANAYWEFFTKQSEVKVKFWNGYEFLFFADGHKESNYVEFNWVCEVFNERLIWLEKNKKSIEAEEANQAIKAAKKAERAAKHAIVEAEHAANREKKRLKLEAEAIEAAKLTQT